MDAAGKAKDIMARALKIDPQLVHDKLELGGIPQWDSFGHIALMMALESEYGIPVSEENVLRHTKFSVIVESISEKQL